MAGHIFKAPLRIATLALLVAVMTAGFGQSTQGAANATARAYGLATRVIPSAYLRMPHRADGAMPRLLSQTGAFENTRSLVHAAGLIPYDLIVPFWSDGAVKNRWVAIPVEKVVFSPGEWKFPKGTVFVKTFEVTPGAVAPGVVAPGVATPGVASQVAKRRLETRILVLDEDGGVYGVDYKWRSDNSDADLLDAGLTENITVATTAGVARTQAWYYPSRQDCLTCHNARAGGVLGVKTRQMNHDFVYPSGNTDNELRTWSHLGLFTTALEDADLPAMSTLASSTDLSRSVEDRARSYLDANCSHCHQPGGTVANFDARYDTPLDKQALIDGPVLIDQGIDKPKIIAPHDPWRSIALMRVNTTGEIKMPPLARNTLDPTGIELLNQWIMSLPGRSVLTPPVISPAGGTFESPIEVTLTEPEPGTQVRYTLDGSVPSTGDALYDKPIKLTGPAVLRTRAYKDGFTRSIINQEVFIVSAR